MGPAGILIFVGLWMVSASLDRIAKAIEKDQPHDQ